MCSVYEHCHVSVFESLRLTSSYGKGPAITERRNPHVTALAGLTANTNVGFTGVWEHCRAHVES